MPELPDLEYVRPILEEELVGKQLRGIEVFEPVVLRNMIGGSLGEFSGLVFRVLRHGPFLTFALEKAAGSAPGVSKKAVAGGTGSRAGTRKPSDDLGGIPEPPGNSGGLTQKADEGLARVGAAVELPEVAHRHEVADVDVRGAEDAAREHIKDGRRDGSLARVFGTQDCRLQGAGG